MTEEEWYQHFRNQGLHESLIPEAVAISMGTSEGCLVVRDENE